VAEATAAAEAHGATETLFVSKSAVPVWPATGTAAIGAYGGHA
jgi:hypothetical protein